MNAYIAKSEYDGTSLAVAERRVDHPRAVLQIAHGMAEHKERYYELMEFFAARGIASLIHDHRGHGASVRAEKDLGFFGKGGADGVLADMAQLTRALRAEYPGVPVYLLGHSMGALAARAYAQLHGALLAGLVITGNPGHNAFAPAAVSAARLAQRAFGPRAMLRPVTLAMFAPFRRKSRARYSRNGWICSDRAVVDAYDADPLCGFEFTANGYEALLTLMLRADDPKAPAPNPRMPVAFFSGADDPCMAGERLLRRAAQLLKDAGYASVTVKLYPGMKHEILNEPRKADVRADIAETLDRWIASARTDPGESPRP